MVESPLISIIIPVYNVADYIADCLHSVMRQTYTGEMECLLVDDCGNDHSIEVAQELISEYKGRIVFRILQHERNRGLSAARNTGIVAATGYYVYFLDSDDYISDDCIATLVAPLAEHDYDIVIGDFEVVGNDWGVPRLIAKEGAYTGNILSMYCTKKIYMMAWNKLIKKSFVECNNLYFKEGMLHEDDHMSFRAFAAAESIYVSSHKTYHYLMRENGIMSSCRYTIRNRDGYAETLLMIADYMRHNKRVKYEVHECLNNRYLSKVAKISDEQHISFYDIYKQLRERYSFPYKEQLRRDYFEKGRCIMRMHYLLGTSLGYLYFKLVRKCFGYQHI